MNGSLESGVVLTLLAGVCQGSFMAPTKAMRGWAWENYWLIFAITAYLVSPWVLALSTIPGLFHVYAGTSGGTLAILTVFGIAWGGGALMFGLGVEVLGLALGFAVILGTTAVFGTVVPLLTATTSHFSRQQAVLTTLSLVLMLVGVAVCSYAGKWKESKQGVQRLYRRGVVICVASGLLSACGNLGFVFGRPITARAEMLGVPAQLAPNAVWTLLTLPLFVCNAGYSLYLARRNATAHLFRGPDAPRCLALGILMGVLWMAGFGLYGMGARRLGDLGPSLGWAMLMSTIVLVANGFGIATGEWKNAPAASKRQLAAGVALLVCAVTGLGFANQ
jgi:L-rhamnose-H+ transport protein